jgi:hypothetical protein
MIRRRLGRSGLLRSGLATLAACVLIGACGGETSNPILLGGESHFLQQCTRGAEASCGPGFDCISGVCTRGCLVSETSCSDLSAVATCTAASIEPGAVAVCDVSCSSDGDCAALGVRHQCDGGFCRAPASAGPLGAMNGGAAGLGDRGGTASTTQAGAGGQGTGAADCAAFRDDPGSVGVEVFIRNERSAPIYVHHAGCGSAYRLVEFDRPIQLPADSCDWRHCDDVQDDGVWSEPCPAQEPCGTSARIRIDPGTELSAGQYQGELVTYSGATEMPEACFIPDGELPIGGITCYAEVPLAGAYRASAAASSLLDCPQDPRDGECNCTPDITGTCAVGTGRGGGELLTSTVDFVMPSTRATITFRDE